MSKTRIEDLPVWATDLSLGAKLFWLCHFNQADINRETVRGTIALLEQPEAYVDELSQAGWIKAEGNSICAVVPATV